ncbi:HAMP domain-containing sensor histidine kinase [Nitrosomonas sp.]|uniref:sensor histidine kinase n=1 Tax=Nitrosomonas sp. TaxID=42353 RepID=UPI001D9ABCE1|nr:HAMP domain-containing sensor histidine kinase [Nitrosomonas sp.]MCB1947995.1 HAMP domain-containing histidine kinase [Nitrosomonas sp.]MCP5243858.1 HAMP domain-containing histidine kinase [Burkholderiales bacterium]MDR4513483.1 HAMP domain-containing histidine kinase [Nitrosomonas sp.]
MTSVQFDWKKTSNSVALPVNNNYSDCAAKLNDDILISNIRWFIIFRWGIIGALILIHVIAILTPDTLIQFRTIEENNWPIIITLILGIANLLYIYALNYCKPSKFNTPSINLWSQIIVDLICLSVVVHFIGSTATPAPFFYILHIALACIFFSTLESLLVALIVSGMYTIVLLIEFSFTGQFSTTITVDPAVAQNGKTINHMLFWMIALDVLFFTVWYLVSRLSLVVRAHEHQLAEAYKRINQAQHEKDQYAVLMTHQLKSPLDAIRSKINLIKGGYCGEVPQEIKETLLKIDRRATNMAGLILDLLRLQRLKETCSCNADNKPVDIRKTIQKCIDKLTPVINNKGIIFNVSIDHLIYNGIPDQVEILMENIIANAITYSYENGSVEITSNLNKQNNSATLTIADHGIGIENDDLPNIFNEYFYSPRAALHNKATSGIGLSIVKIAAENNHLNINVTSEPDKGTAFTIIFPEVQFSETVRKAEPNEIMDNPLQQQ